MDINVSDAYRIAQAGFLVLAGVRVGSLVVRLARKGVGEQTNAERYCSTRDGIRKAETESTRVMNQLHVVRQVCHQ